MAGWSFDFLEIYLQKEFRSILIEFIDAKGCNFCNIFQASWIDKFPEMDVSLGDIRVGYVHPRENGENIERRRFQRSIIRFVEAFLTQGISFTSAFRIKEHDKWRFDELLTSDKLIVPRTRFLLFFNTKILLRVQRGAQLNHYLPV